MSQPILPNPAKSEEIAQLAGVAVEQFQRHHRRAMRFELDIELQHSLATAIVRLFPSMEITSLSGRLKIDNTTQPWAETFTLAKACDGAVWIGPGRCYTMPEMEDIVLSQCLSEAGLGHEDSEHYASSFDIDFKPLVWPTSGGHASPEIVPVLAAMMESHRQAQLLADQTPRIASPAATHRRM